MQYSDHNHDPDDGLTNDDVDMLQQVLMNVRGSYPDSPYRQADYKPEFEPEG